MRYVVLTAMLRVNLLPILVLLGSIAVAQTDPAFEVASVKPNPGTEASFSFNISSEGSVSLRNMTVWNLIRFAFGLRDLEMDGGPGWIKTEGFDIQAAPPSIVAREEALAMLRTLLRERFQLRTHTESRPQPAYALVVDGAVTRLKPSTEAGSARMQIGQLDVKKMGLKQLAQILEFDLERPVLDRTGISGDFAIQLEWMPERERTAAGPVDTSAARPSIFVALQEQLGLKLESIRTPVDTLVIDSVERPSEN